MREAIKVDQLSRYPWRTVDDDVTGSLWITQYSRRLAGRNGRSSVLGVPLACLILQLLVLANANRIPAGTKVSVEAFVRPRENFM